MNSQTFAVGMIQTYHNLPKETLSRK